MDVETLKAEPAEWSAEAMSKIIRKIDKPRSDLTNVQWKLRDARTEGWKIRDSLLLSE